MPGNVALDLVAEVMGCLAYGLDMGRGSFLEGSVSDVESAIEDIE